MRDRRSRPDSFETREGRDTDAREEPYLLWFGGFIAVALLIGAFAAIAGSNDWVSLGGSPAVLAAAGQTTFSPAGADRTSCTEIGRSDLRSPTEGIWVQANCLTASEPSRLAASTSCNRKALDPAEFRQVSPGLYVFTQSRMSSSFLWASTSEGCFDLVSSRVVSAVCADRAVTFEWDAHAACKGHGGVLAWVNGN